MDPTRLLLVVGLLVVVTLLGRWWQSRDGRVKEIAEGDGRFDPDQLAAVGLGDARAPVVGLLLGSPTCAPCATVKRVLGELADARDDFSWVYVDAADHLDIAKDHHVLRVPTLFLLNRRGRILARTSGVPALRDLDAVIDGRTTTLAA